MSKTKITGLAEQREKAELRERKKNAQKNYPHKLDLNNFYPARCPSPGCGYKLKAPKSPTKVWVGVCMNKHAWEIDLTGPRVKLLEIKETDPDYPRRNIYHG